MSLEPSQDEIAAMLDTVKSHLLKYIESIPSESASDLEGGPSRARSCSTSLPRSPEPLEDLLRDIIAEIIPNGVNTMHPGYFGYIPSGGITVAAIAQLVADTVNRYTTLWETAPALAQLEAIVIGWFGEIMGYQPPTKGFLTTGASMATFSALLAARWKHVPDFFLRGTLYVSDQAHGSVRKAARMIGIPDDHVRDVPSDAMFRMCIPKLEQMIKHDRQGGLQPFVLVGTAGTTNTGAVDDLVELKRIAAEQGLWFHVDAAYGGFFMLTERGKGCLKGIEHADSIAVDPHKGLCFPYGIGALLCRDETALRRAHLTKGAYLPKEGEQFDLCRLSPELTRDARGLKVWLPLKMLGIDPFRANLDEKLDMIAWATQQLREIDHIEIVAEPQLTLVAFRLKPPNMKADALNELNEDLLTKINEEKRVYLTGTKLGDMFVLRICVLSCRSHREHITECIEIVRRASKGVWPH